MRALIRSLLVADAGAAAFGLSASNILAGNTDMIQARPYIGLRWQPEQVGYVAARDSRIRSVDMAVYDDPDDYSRIDAILRWATTVLESASGQADPETGRWVADIRWAGSGSDLRDDARGTILRIGTFLVTGE